MSLSWPHPKVRLHIQEAPSVMLASLPLGQSFDIIGQTRTPLSSYTRTPVVARTLQGTRRESSLIFVALSKGHLPSKADENGNDFLSPLCATSLETSRKWCLFSPSYFALSNPVSSCVFPWREGSGFWAELRMRLKVWPQGVQSLSGRQENVRRVQFCLTLTPTHPELTLQRPLASSSSVGSWNNSWDPASVWVSFTVKWGKWNTLKARNQSYRFK